MPLLIRKVRKSQSVRIGPDILITCVRDLDGALVLAIEAPQDVYISWPHRKTPLSEPHEQAGAATVPHA